MEKAEIKKEIKKALDKHSHVKEYLELTHSLGVFIKDYTEAMYKIQSNTGYPDKTLIHKIDNQIDCNWPLDIPKNYMSFNTRQIWREKDVSLNFIEAKLQIARNNKKQ